MKKVLVHQINENSKIKCVIELVKIDGNDRAYFSVICYFYEKRNNRWKDAGSIPGDHDGIDRYFPQIKPISLMHLSDDVGIPMHFIANAEYHCGFGQYSSANSDILSKHCRISLETAEMLVQLKKDDKMNQDRFRSFLQQQLQRYNREAIAAKELLMSLGY